MPACYADVTGTLQRQPRCLRDGRKCLFQAALNQYKLYFPSDGCLPEAGYLRLVYRCALEAAPRALDACSAKPCLNGGQCEPTSELPNYYCKCHSLFKGQRCETGRWPGRTDTLKKNLIMERENGTSHRVVGL